MPNIKTKDISNNFKKLADSFEGMNYQIWIEAWVFSFRRKKGEFSIQDFNNIFSNKLPEEVDGMVTNISWFSALSDINKSLSYTSYDIGIQTQDEMLNIAPPDLRAKRLKEFWGIVEKYISIPPQVVYHHYPKGGSHFCDYMMWGFCYIFLNDQKGLVIHAGASD